MGVSLGDYKVLMKMMIKKEKDGIIKIIWEIKKDGREREG